MSKTVNHSDELKLELMARLEKLRQRNRKLRDEPTKGVSKDIQAKVDEYIELDAEFKKIKAELSAMRDEIQPYMEENNLTVIKGSLRGAISLSPRSQAPITARYSSYNVDEVSEFLDAKGKRKAIVKVVDRDVLEMMIKEGSAPEELLQLKQYNETTTFTISHK